MDVFAWMTAQVKAAPQKQETAVPTRRKKSPGGRQPRFPQQAYDTAWSLLAGRRATLSDIARQSGLSRSYVRRLRERINAGLPKPVSKERPSDETCRQLAAMVARGMTVKAAADQLMLPLATARGIITWRLGTSAEALRRDAANPPQPANDNNPTTATQEGEHA